MIHPFLFKIFEGLPRQGPGDFRCTKKAFEISGPHPPDAEILDAGCGCGMQTIDLAKICRECRITAVDIHQPFLDELNIRAEKEGVAERIKTVCASMDELPFEEERFDLIWAEGSVYTIGVEKAAEYFRTLLKPGGRIAFTEAAWFTDKPSKETLEFWSECYPEMKNEDENARILISAGYRNIKTFRLPAYTWTDNFYIPLEKRVLALKEEYPGDTEQEMLDFNLREMEMFRKFSSEYGYTFFIAEKI